MNLRYSETESRILGLRIARAALDVLDERILRDEILAGQYDLCKIKLPLTDPGLQIKLDRLGMPYVITDHTHSLKADLRKQSTKPLRHPELVFELYEPSQSERMKKLVTEVFRDTPASYYLNPILTRIISEGALHEALGEWVSGFYSDHATLGKKAWFVKLNDLYVGVYVAELSERVVETIVAGVLPKYRKKGIHLDIVRFAQNYFISRHIPFAFSATQIHNIPVYRSFIREEVDVRGCYASVQINSFLSYHHPDRPVFDLEISGREEFSRLDTTLLNVLGENYLAKRVYNVALQPLQQDRTFTLRAAVIYDNSKEALLVVMGSDSSGELQFIRYLEATTV